MKIKNKFFYKNIFLLVYLTFLEFLSFFLKPKNRKLKFDIRNKKVQKILVSNLAHLGDAAMCIDFIDKIKLQHPDSKLYFLGNSIAKNLVLLHPSIVKYYKFDHWKLNRKNLFFLSKLIIFSFDLFKTSYTLRKEKFDLGLDLYPFYPNSSFIFWLSNIRHTVGFSSGGADRLYSLSVTFQKVDIGMYKNLNNLKKFVMSQSTLDSKTKTKLLSKYSFKKVDITLQDYVAIHMGSSTSSKDWKLENWLILCKSIRLPIIFTGLGEDDLYKSNFLIKNGINAKNLVNKLDLPNLLNILRNSEYIFTIDTFVSHISHLFKIPSVIIYTIDFNYYFFRPKNEGSFLSPKPEEILAFVRKKTKILK